MVLDKGRDIKDKDQFTAAWGSSQQQVWTSAESSGWSEWRGMGKREKREGSRLGLMKGLDSVAITSYLDV